MLLAKYIYLFLATIIYSHNTFASNDNCTVAGRNQLDVNLLNFIQSANQINCVHTRKKYQCEKMELKLKDNEKAKIIQCDKKSLEANNIADTVLYSCIFNGLKLSGDNLVDLAKVPGAIIEASMKGFHETHDCNNNLLKKRQLLNLFNASISDKRFMLEESFIGNKLHDMSCSEIEKLLNSRYDNYKQQISREMRIAKNSGGNYKVPDELMSNNSGLLQSLEQALEQANISYNCYTPKAKAEWMCTTLTSLLADMALGVGISKSVISAKNIMRVKSELPKWNEASGGFNLTIAGAKENTELSGIKKTSEQLDRMKVPNEYHNYYGENVVRIMPVDSKETPRWLKMAKRLDEKHQIPTYIEPVNLKPLGFEGLSHRVPTKGTSIILDSDFITSHPENVKFLMAHEAVHATGDRRILLGKVGPDNDLKMNFKSTSSSLSSKLPKSYSHFFYVEEVKAYFKQGKMIETYLKNNEGKLPPDIRKQFSDEAKIIKMYTQDISRASKDLLNQTEQFLSENPILDKKFTKITQRSGNESNEIFDITINVTRNGKDSFEFTIPIRAPEAAQSGQINNLNQRIIQIIHEAKKTVRYYQSGSL